MNLQYNDVQAELYVNEIKFYPGINRPTSTS